jgi:hypothetical protein
MMLDIDIHEGEFHVYDHAGEVLVRIVRTGGHPDQGLRCARQARIATVDPVRAAYRAPPGHCCLVRVLVTA